MGWYRCQCQSNALGEFVDKIPQEAILSQLGQETWSGLLVKMLIFLLSRPKTLYCFSTSRQRGGTVIDNTLPSEGKLYLVSRIFSWI